MAHRAFQVLVLAHQGRGHRSRGDHEGLGLERAEKKRQHEGNITDSTVSRIAAGENQEASAFFASDSARAASEGLRRLFDSEGLRFAMLRQMP